MSIAEIQGRIAEIESRIASLSAAAPARPAPVSQTGSAQFASVLSSTSSAAGLQRGIRTAVGTTTPGAPVAPGTPAASLPGRAVSGDALVASARKYLGVPYVYGGTDPKIGLDCSALVQLVARENGITVPRTAAQQAKAGTAVPSLAQAKPGDLVVLEGGGHIGIYVGDGQMLHAPRTGGVVKIAKVWETPMTIRRLSADAPATPASFTRPSGLTGTSAPTGTGKAAPYEAAFTAAEQKYGLPTGLLSAVAKQESGYDPDAKSPVGARGLMQFMPATAREMGIDPLNPAQAIDGAGRLLSSHLKTFGSLELALAAYNAGPGNVRKHGGIPPFAETQNYVKKITATLGRTA